MNENIFKSFNLNDFKKWIDSQHKEEKEENIVGLHVESKINAKKLISRINVQDGDEKELAIEFRNNGGTISEVDKNNFLIEVDSGFFIIHKMYVKF